MFRQNRKGMGWLAVGLICVMIFLGGCSLPFSKNGQTTDPASTKEDATQSEEQGTAAVVTPTKLQIQSSIASLADVLLTDEYLLLPMTGNSNYEILDAENNIVGMCRGETEMGTMPRIVSRNSVMPFWDGDSWQIYSMKTLSLLPISAKGEQTNVRTAANCFLVTDTKTGYTTVYDFDGKEIYVMQARKRAAEYETYIMDTGTGVLICQSNLENGAITASPVYIDYETGAQTQIACDKLFEQMTESQQLTGFGQYLVVTDWNQSFYTLYDFQGTPLEQNVTVISSSLVSESYGTENGRYDYILACYKENTVVLYDLNRKKIGEITRPDEDGADSLCFYGDYVYGMSYPELGGNICTGFLEYDQNKQAPVAAVAGRVFTCIGNQSYEIPLEAGESLESLNADYAVVTNYGEDAENQKIRLVNLKTGKTIQTGNYDFEKDSYEEFSLGDGFYVYRKYSGEDTDVVQIIDKDQKLRYQTKSYATGPFGKNVLYMQRGVHTGLIDLEGNWIVQNEGTWEE